MLNPIKKIDMIKKLLASIIIMFVYSSMLSQSYKNQITDDTLFSSADALFLNINSIVGQTSKNKKKDFTHKKQGIVNSCTHHSSHSDHTHDETSTDQDVALIDIITSDEGSDLNCSGGFCMEKSHHHKKGLTLKRQLFNYFMKMSC